MVPGVFDKHVKSLHPFARKENLDFLDKEMAVRPEGEAHPRSPGQFMAKSTPNPEPNFRADSQGPRK